jgi:uncharacterized protein (DUF1800 family)
MEPEAVVDVPSAADRHLLSRFSWGVSQSLVAQSAAAGGARAWFDAQLEASSGFESQVADLDTWWPHLKWSPARKFAADDTGECVGTEQSNDFARWTILRRIMTDRQLLEVMTDVWSNVLYVTLEKKAFQHRPMFDATIREHALGTYEELLTAAVLHPGMLCYLDNARSTAKAPNENLGRELLELHTVGRSAGYTEEDVQNSTRILTGYRVRLDGTCSPYYAPENHYIGHVKVLDFEHDNALADGRAVTIAYLSYLARHEATAKHIARVLATRFVSDTPSQNLVDTLVAAYLGSGTDIKTTLRALVDHPDFAASAGAKVRTPIEDLINTYRTLQITVLPPGADMTRAATTILGASTTMGQKPYDWPRPDGFPDNGDAWSSASRMLGCWRIHKNLANGVFPKTGVEYQPPSKWLGPMPVRFDDLVDRMCRLVLAKPSSARLLQTGMKVFDITAGESITEFHRVSRRSWVLLLALLDAPDHMTR